MDLNELSQRDQRCFHPEGVNQEIKGSLGGSPLNGSAMRLLLTTAILMLEGRTAPGD